MNVKQSQIRQILYAAADQIAELFAEPEMTMQPLPVYLTRKELVKQTSLSLSTIDRVIKEMEAAGAPGILRFGKAIKIELNDYLNFMKER